MTGQDRAFLEKFEEEHPEFRAPNKFMEFLKLIGEPILMLCFFASGHPFLMFLAVAWLLLRRY